MVAKVKGKVLLREQLPLNNYFFWHRMCAKIWFVRSCRPHPRFRAPVGFQDNTSLISIAVWSSVVTKFLRAVRGLRPYHSNDAEYKERTMSTQKNMPRRIHQPDCKNNVQSVQVAYPDPLYGQKGQGNRRGDPVIKWNPHCETNVLVTENQVCDSLCLSQWSVCKCGKMWWILHTSYNEATVACIVVLGFLPPLSFANKTDHANFHLYGPRVWSGLVRSGQACTPVASPF